MSRNVVANSASCDYCTVSPATNMSDNLLRSVYSKDSNFYYTKSLNEILNSFRSRADLMYREWLQLSEKKEELRRYYTQLESDVRLKNYANYYSEIEDYQQPCLEKVASRNVLYKRKKRKFKFYQRIPEMFMQSERRANLAGEVHHRRFLRRLAHQTVYLEDLFLERSTSEAEDNQIDDRNDVTAVQLTAFFKDEGVEVHDIFNPVFSSEEEDDKAPIGLAEMNLSKGVSDSVFNLSLTTQISCLERASATSISKPCGEEFGVLDQSSLLELRDKLSNSSESYFSEPIHLGKALIVGVDQLNRADSVFMIDTAAKFRRRNEPIRSVIDGSKKSPKFGMEAHLAKKKDSSVTNVKTIIKDKKGVKTGMLIRQESQGGESLRARSNCSKKSSSVSSNSKNKPKKCLFNFSSRLKDKLKNAQLSRKQEGKGPSCVDSLIDLLHLKTKIDKNCNFQASRETLTRMNNGKSFSEAIFETHLSTGPLCQTDRIDIHRNLFRTYCAREDTRTGRPSSTVLNSADERTRVSLSSYMSPMLKKTKPVTRDSTTHHNSLSSSIKPIIPVKTDQKKSQVGSISHRSGQQDWGQVVQEKMRRGGGSRPRADHTVGTTSYGQKKQLTHLRFEPDFSEMISRGLMSPAVDSRFTPISGSKVSLGFSKTESRKENKMEDFNHLVERSPSNVCDILKAFKQRDLSRVLVGPLSKSLQRKNKELQKKRTPPTHPKCIN